MVYTCTEVVENLVCLCLCRKEQGGDCWASGLPIFFRMAYLAITSSPTTSQPTSSSKEAAKTKRTQKPDARE